MPSGTTHASGAPVNPNVTSGAGWAPPAPASPTEPRTSPPAPSSEMRRLRMCSAPVHRDPSAEVPWTGAPYPPPHRQRGEPTGAGWVSAPPWWVGGALDRGLRARPRWVRSAHAPREGDGLRPGDRLGRGEGRGARAGGDVALHRPGDGPLVVRALRDVPEPVARAEVR